MYPFCVHSLVSVSVIVFNRQYLLIPCVYYFAVFLSFFLHYVYYQNKNEGSTIILHVFIVSLQINAFCSNSAKCSGINQPAKSSPAILYWTKHFTIYLSFTCGECGMVCVWHWPGHQDKFGVQSLWS